MLPPSKEAPELHINIPDTSPCCVDDYADIFTRSLSESKIELNQSEDTIPEVQSYTLDRYNRKQKKHKQLSHTKGSVSL